MINQKQKMKKLFFLEKITKSELRIERWEKKNDLLFGLLLQKSKKSIFIGNPFIKVSFSFYYVQVIRAYWEKVYEEETKW